MTFTQAKARKTSSIEFVHIDGSIQGGMVNGTLAKTFCVTSFPRYGDTVSRRFEYNEVAEILNATPRDYISLPTFSRLMNGAL